MTNRLLSAGDGLGPVGSREAIATMHGPELTARLTHLGVGVPHGIDARKQALFVSRYGSLL